MLRAENTSVWRSDYRITANGRDVTEFSTKWWKSGGRFELDGREYEVRANMWGSKYGMATADGARVAAAERVGRKQWTVEADGLVYHFQRASVWSQDQLLVVDGEQVGRIRRASVWKGGAAAELPGVSLPVQIFVVAVVLTMWANSSAAAAGAAGAASS